MKENEMLAKKTEQKRPFLCLMRRKLCALKGVLRLEKISPPNPRFKP